MHPLIHKMSCSINNMNTKYVFILPKFKIAMLPNTQQNGSHPLTKLSLQVVNQGKIDFICRDSTMDGARHCIPQTSQTPDLNGKRAIKKDMKEVLCTIVAIDTRYGALYSFVTTHSPYEILYFLWYL